MGGVARQFILSNELFGFARFLVVLLIMNRVLTSNRSYHDFRDDISIKLDS